MKRRILTMLPLVVMAALLGLFANRLTAPRLTGAVDSPLIGHPAPDIGAGPVTGPYIVNFFASWCAPCVVEMPHLLELQKQGIAIIGVATRDTPEVTARFLAKNGNPYSQILTDNGDGAGITMGITGVPESFAVDAQNIVRARVQGPLEDDAVITPFLATMGLK